MGIFDRFRDQPQSSGSTVAEATLADIVQRYDIVDVARADNGEPYIVVSDRVAPSAASQLTVPGSTLPVDGDYARALAARASTEMDTSEIGTSSPSPFTSFARREYNEDLMGLRGLQAYDRMRKSDGVVKGTLRVIKTPVLAARWFIEPASESKIDQNKADFVWNCLTEYMSISWPQLLTEALLMADFGYYMFEKVWIDKLVNGQKRWVWQKLAPRHPMDVRRWLYDAAGGPAGVVMYGAAPNTPFGGNVMPIVNGTVNGQPVPDAFRGTFTSDGRPFDYLGPDEYVIPISKLLVFTFDREAGNIEGISALRSAYKHWYYKEQLYKIDAIQKERHGIGIPVIKLPPGYTPADKAVAEQLGRNLRTNERAHVVLPPFWEIMFAKIEGNPVDSLKSIKVHDEAIRENVLAAFNGSDTATKEEDQVMFLKATRFIAEIVCETFNLYGIPELVDNNFATTEKYPKLKVRRIGESADWRTISFAIRNLIGAGVITPDERLEEHMRNEMDLPKADPKTRREIKTPQGPPNQQDPNQPGDPNDPNNQPQTKGVQNINKNTPGLPRQTPPSAQPPRGNGGRDASGGK